MRSCRVVKNCRINQTLRHCEPVRTLVWQSVSPCGSRGNGTYKSAHNPKSTSFRGSAFRRRFDVSILMGFPSRVISPREYTLKTCPRHVFLTLRHCRGNPHLWNVRVFACLRLKHTVFRAIYTSRVSHCRRRERSHCTSLRFTTPNSSFLTPNFPKCLASDSKLRYNTPAL